MLFYRNRKQSWSAWLCVLSLVAALGSPLGATTIENWNLGVLDEFLANQETVAQDQCHATVGMNSDGFATFGWNSFLPAAAPPAPCAKPPAGDLDVLMSIFQEDTANPGQYIPVEFTGPGDIEQEIEEDCFVLGVDPTELQRNPDIEITRASLPSNELAVVAWATGTEGATDAYDAKVRTFNAETGAPDSVEIDVNLPGAAAIAGGTSGSRMWPDVAVVRCGTEVNRGTCAQNVDNGSFVVLWINEDSATSLGYVFSQAFDEAGNKDTVSPVRVSLLDIDIPGATAVLQPGHRHQPRRRGHRSVGEHGGHAAERSRGRHRLERVRRVRRGDHGGREVRRCGQR